MKLLVSLIICTYSRPETLQDTLKSIQAQQMDGSFDLEVVIVDNSPTGQMRSAIEPYLNSFNDLRYIQETVQGKSRALNQGVRNAKGQIIAFTDDDVLADPQWLSTLVRCLREHHCDGVGGRVLPIFPKETPDWIRANPVKIAGGVVIYDYGDSDFRYDETRYPFIGANYAFRREIFDQCGLFRTDVGPGTSSMGEDTEFIERLVEQGKILYYCGRAVIWHPVDLKRLTLRHIAHWHIALGRFAARREIEKNVVVKAYFLGIPRYIYKGILLDAVAMPLYLFNRIKFLDSWRAYFRKLGMIYEYSDIRKKSRQ